MPHTGWLSIAPNEPMRSPCGAHRSRTTGDEMNLHDRNPWQGLNSSQLAQLKDAENRPNRLLRDSDTYREIAREFADRTVSTLVGNDLKGALDAAEIATAARRIAEDMDTRHKAAALRLMELRRQEAEDPRGQLVAIAGHKKRKRLTTQQGRGDESGPNDIEQRQHQDRQSPRSEPK